MFYTIYDPLRTKGGCMIEPKHVLWARLVIAVLLIAAIIYFAH